MNRSKDTACRDAAVSAAQWLRWSYFGGLALLLLLWTGAGKRLVSIDYFIMGIVVVTATIGVFLYRAVLLSFGSDRAKRSIGIYIITAPIFHIGVIVYPIVIMHDIRRWRQEGCNGHGVPGNE